MAGVCAVCHQVGELESVLSIWSPNIITLAAVPFGESKMSFALGELKIRVKIDSVCFPYSKSS